MRFFDSAAFFEGTNSCGSSPTMYELPPQLPEDQGKLTVVLDVDETLVHSELISLGANEEQNPITTHEENGDVFTFAIQGFKLKVRKRPFLDSFLKEASKRFELIAFTAGVEEYAKPLLDTLDPDQTIFRHRLFRQHCFNKDGVTFIKDLRVLNRPLNRTVMVDNNCHSFFLQLENGIPIESFFNNASDKALITLYHLLESIDPMQDVRYVLIKLFRLHTTFGNAARQMQYMVMQQA